MKYNVVLSELNKSQLFNLGIVITKAFAKLNNLPSPIITLIDNKINSRGACRYKPNLGTSSVYIDLKKCRFATKNPGFAWTYPAYKSDITPMGVLAHEFGHHMHFHFKINTRLVPMMNPITSYEPNSQEVFAETARLFILNPDLLRFVSPKRYIYFMARFKPVIEESWQEVLKDAPEKIIQNILKNYCK